jgi:DNA-binding transcriptional LysR family regulator
MEIEAPGSFYLCWTEDRPLSESASRLRDWLLEVGKRES